MEKMCLYIVRFRLPTADQIILLETIQDNNSFQTDLASPLHSIAIYLTPTK